MEEDSTGGKQISTFIQTKFLLSLISYWDASYNDYNYSYVEKAVDQFGFSTLTWDRLGIGESQQNLEALQVQASLEVAALKALTDAVHNGTVPGLQHQFEKVVHAGHSIGSAMTFGLISGWPTISDGVALTGFSLNGTFSPYFSYGANFFSVTEVPAYADRYPAGYVVTVNEPALQANFLAPKAFDPEVLPWLLNNTQPNSVGELLTLAGGGGANNYTGPLIIITGEWDLPFCGGNCYATGDPEVPDIPSLSRAAVSAAEPFEVVIVKGAGHGLNFEYSHEKTYEDVNNFFLKN